MKLDANKIIKRKLSNGGAVQGVLVEEEEGRKGIEFALQSPDNDLLTIIRLTHEAVITMGMIADELRKPTSPAA